MAFCGKCGNLIKEGNLYCSVCGEKVPDIYNVDTGKDPQVENKVYEAYTVDNSRGNTDETPVPSKKDRFAGIGFKLSLVGFICSFIPFISIYTSKLSLVGLVFCIISGRSQNESVRSQSKKGLIFGIIGLVLAVVINVITYMIIWIAMYGNYIDKIY